MKRTLKNIWKSLSRTHGNSLAEFATVAALMATLAATAAPKLSEIAENTKAEKSSNEIGKILKQAQTFYNDKAEDIQGGGDGRGRFPGQDKFDKKVGGYATIEDALAVLGPGSPNSSGATTDDFVAFNNGEGSKWRSVFGVDNETAPAPIGYKWSNDRSAAECNTCDDNDGDTEWKKLFAGNSLASPYQDGHFIYVVIKGEHNATTGKVAPPILIVADAENPADFNAWLEP